VIVTDSGREIHKREASEATSSGVSNEFVVGIRDIETT